MKVSPKVILKRIPRIDPQYCKKEKQNETTKKIGKGIQQRKKETNTEPETHTETKKGTKKES